MLEKRWRQEDIRSDNHFVKEEHAQKIQPPPGALIYQNTLGRV